MRFGISHVLDAIEQRLSTDPTRAGGVCDLGEVIRLADLDRGRAATLLRLGLIVDAVGHHLADDSITVYVVAGRGVMSDNELTANEKIVVRRWSDDGLIEVVPTNGPSAAERAREVAALTGLPLITRDGGGYPGLTYAPVASTGIAALAPTTLGPGPAAPHAVLARRWRCTEPDCPSFAPGLARATAPARALAPEAGTEPSDSTPTVQIQPPPQLRAGRAFCPRHGTPLTDCGPTPRAVAVSVRISGLTWHRFVVTEGQPTVVGRAPEEPGSVPIGLGLDDQGLLWVSRSHLQLELRGNQLQVTDTSTNGTTVLRRTEPGSVPQRTPLARDESVALGEWDSIELTENMELIRSARGRGPAAGAPNASVLNDAPTQLIRPTGI